MKLKHLILLSVSGTIIALDQLTKQIVLERFRLGESISVIEGFFSLTYVRNPGAAFGILGRWDSAFRIPFFIIVPLLALLVIVLIFRKVEDRDLWLSLALSLVIGGAVGNLIDRAAYNYVVDFLDFHWGVMGPHFPAFNIADIAICVGVGLLMIDIFKKERMASKKS
jgi:signal peptidase II